MSRPSKPAFGRRSISGAEARRSTPPSGSSLSRIRSSSSRQPSHCWNPRQLRISAQTFTRRCSIAPPFLIQLIRPDRFSRDQVTETCRNFIKIYTRLDIRVARLVPGRSEDQYRLEVPYIVRILEILNEISAGPKLVLIMNHLTRHPDSRVASKALLLMGRRIQNRSWEERNVKSEDPRKRASVVEALWCRNNAWSRQTMWAALQDENNRVVGNALVGLHSLGESRVRDLVRCMLR